MTMGRAGDETPSKAWRAWMLQWGILLAIVLAMWAPRLRGPIDLRWDAGVYYVLGTSMAEGKGYRLLNEPGEIPAVQYPPLLPAVVAAHQWALGTHDVTVVGPWLRVWSLATTVAFILLAHALLARYVPGWWATAGAAFTALYINTFYLSDNLYTEIPFAVATMIFLLAAGPRTDRAPAAARAVWRECLAGAAAIAAYLLRTAGVAVLAAWVFDALLARRWRLAAARAAVAALPVLAWQGYLWSVTHGQDYRQVAYEYQRAPYYYSNVTYAQNTALIDPFRPEQGAATGAARRRQMLRNAAELAFSTGAAMSTFQDIWANEFRSVGWKVFRIRGTRRWERLAYVAVGALALLAAGGAVIIWRRGGRLVVLYAMLTYALLLLIPWPQQYVRYLMPLTPVLWLFALAAMTAALAAARGRLRTAAVACCALVLAGVLMSQLWALAWSFKGGLNTVVYHAFDGRRTTGKLLYFSPPWQGLMESLQWVRRRAAPGDVVATTIPHSAYAWTGTKAVLPPLERNRDEARRLLDAVPVRYVVTDIIQYPRISQRYAEPAVSGDPARWRKVFTSSVGRSSVYERIALGDAAPATSTSPTTAAAATRPSDEVAR